MLLILWNTESPRAWKCSFFLKLLMYVIYAQHSMAKAHEFHQVIDLKGRIKTNYLYLFFTTYKLHSYCSCSLPSESYTYSSSSTGSDSYSSRIFLSKFACLFASRFFFAFFAFFTSSFMPKIINTSNDP